MRIDEYYRNVARINLNGSLMALIPAILIIGGNILFFQNNQIMLLVIPFLLYSIINFQFYIRKNRQAMLIGKNLPPSNTHYSSFFASEQYLLNFYNTFSPKLMIFFPDGDCAGKIIKYKGERKQLGKSSRMFALYDFHDELVCLYTVDGKKERKIKVFDQRYQYLGCLEKSKQYLLKKSKRELLNTEGRFIASVNGSPFYMDEQIVDPGNLLVGRLQRGWMPVEWGRYFPDPNTPLFSFSKGLAENDKRLQLSCLIDEFFIER